MEKHKDIILQWHSYFSKSGEIPVPDDPFDLEWIEENHEFIVDWIESIFDPEDGHGREILDPQLNAMKDILLSIKDVCHKNDNRAKFIEYTKNYRELNIQKIKDKREMYYILNKNNILGKKICDNLNLGITTKPRESTIKKYNLRHDGEKWCIDK